MKQQQPATTIVLYAEDKKGLLGQVLMLLNRRDFPVISLSVARTDIHELVIITLEVVLPQAELHIILHKLEKIIEVYKAEAYFAGTFELNKVGHYRLVEKVLDQQLFELLQRHGAIVCRSSSNELVIQKTGTDRDLQILYDLLEGRHLQSFCKSALIAEPSLAVLNDLDRST
ncbi:MAG: ACT domain-containing protein [Bacteroidota bacterium]